MMDLLFWEPKAFLFGVATGLVCVCGLFVGMKLLIRGQKEAEQSKASNKRLLGGFILVAQFLGAIAILTIYLKTTLKVDPLPLAMGLVGSILVSNFIIAAMRNKE
jgi:hypothetical protein